MKLHGVEDPAAVRKFGVIDLPTIQRYLNFHFSVTIDLFGADQSSNAAMFYSAGLKGRYEESKRNDDHKLGDQVYPVLDFADGHLGTQDTAMLNALNEVLRDDFIKDSVGGIERWNRVITKSGIDFKLTAPHKAFHRNIGKLAGHHFDPLGRPISAAEWQKHVNEWLPSAEDLAYVASLMGRVVEVGKYANWIAAPTVGINRQPIDMEYIRFN